MQSLEEEVIVGADKYIDNVYEWRFPRGLLILSRECEQTMDKSEMQLTQLKVFYLFVAWAEPSKCH